MFGSSILSSLYFLNLGASMDFPFLSRLSISDFSLSNLKQGIGEAFGHAWKTICQIPSKLYQLSVSVGNVAKECFINLCNLGHPRMDSMPPNVSPGLGQNVETDTTETETTEDDREVGPILVKTVPQEIKEEEGEQTKETVTERSSTADSDPLVGMGAMAPELLNERMSLIQKGISGNAMFDIEKIENEILQTVQLIVKPANDLIKTIKMMKFANLARLLELREQLEKELEDLKGYASKFSTLSDLTGHKLVQDTLKALEDQTRLLDKNICTQVRRHYQPNPRIPADGHCLFWSIKSYLNSSENITYYRSLASHFISKNAQEFASGVRDAMVSDQGKKSLLSYAEKRGGVQAWKGEVGERLRRKPNFVDLYCDCLEKSNFWGGTNEVLAFSEALQVPILVFSRKDSLNWRCDIVIGISKFKGTPPIMLYFHSNHYQDLIPR